MTVLFRNASTAMLLRTLAKTVTSIRLDLRSTSGKHQVRTQSDVDCIEDIVARFSRHVRCSYIINTTNN